MPVCRAASAPQRAERASGAGRLAHEPAGRQKRCMPRGVLDQVFGQFEYLTSPSHVSGDFMNTALRNALAPALGDPDRQRKEP